MCRCTCARAHPFFVYQKLLDRLGWNLVRSQVKHNCYWCIPESFGTAARAHVHTPFLYLGNCSTDWSEILYVGRYSTTANGADLKVLVPLHVRTCTHFFVSRKLLDRLIWNIVRRKVSHNRYWCTPEMLGTVARAHVCARVLTCSFESQKLLDGLIRLKSCA